jgi:hypothetical protein
MRHATGASSKGRKSGKDIAQAAGEAAHGVNREVEKLGKRAEDSVGDVAHNVIDKVNGHTPNGGEKRRSVDSNLQTPPDTKSNETELNKANTKQAKVVEGGKVDEDEVQDISKESAGKKKQKKKPKKLQIRSKGADGADESEDGGVTIPEELRTPQSASRPLTPPEPMTKTLSKDTTKPSLSTPDMPLPTNTTDPFITSPPSPLKEASKSITSTDSTSIPVLAHPSEQPRSSSPTRPSKIPKLTPRGSSPPKKGGSPAKSIVTPATSTASLTLDGSAVMVPREGDVTGPDIAGGSNGAATSTAGAEETGN